MLRRIGLTFFAGALGGVVNSLFVWGFGELGLNAKAGVNLAPPLTKEWLYPRIVWGGLWGFLFLLPIAARSPFAKGILLSIAPTLVQLLIIFPQGRGGMLGFQLGPLTPLLVIFFNAVWGITAAFFLNQAGQR